MLIKEDIALDRIEEELKELWEVDPDQNKIKACLFNLIIYTQEQRREAYFKSLVKSIIEKYPCRVLFIQVDRNSREGYLRVSVSNETFVREDLIVACDQITIQAAGDKIVRIPFLVTPHLVPDLPIYLLWGQDPTTPNETFTALEKFASRIIFDSDCTKDLQNFARHMLDQLGHASVDYMDMHWGLTGGWRDVISQMFDTPQTIQKICNSRSIAIYYNNRASDQIYHNDIKAIYLQAWLAAQMRWKFCSIKKQGNIISLTYEGNGKTTEVQLIPEIREKMPVGIVLTIEIETRDGQFFILARNDSLRKVIVHVSTAEKCDLPYTLPMPNIMQGLNFMKEIFYLRTSSHYLNMLKMLATIDWKKV